MTIEPRIPPGARSQVLYRYGGIELVGPQAIIVTAKRLSPADDPDDAAVAELGIAEMTAVMATFEVLARYEEGRDPGPNDGRYAATEVIVNSQAISSTVLSRISPPRLLRAGVAKIQGEFSVGTIDPDSGDYVVRSFWGADELGTAAAWAYGRLIGEDPTRYVAEAFGIKRSTAAQRVARARNRDHLLPPTEQGAH